MAVHVPVMVHTVLIQSHAGTQFRKNRKEDFSVLGQNSAGRTSAQKTCQFAEKPFSRDLFHLVPTFGHGAKRFGFDGKIQLRSKAKSPQNAQRIFAQTSGGISHTADLFGV